MVAERRHCEIARKAVAMRAVCRSFTGLRDNGWLSDISVKGCCFTGTGLFTRVGMPVIVKPESLDSITGKVRWIDGLRVGVEFDAPLYGPVIEHLARMHAMGMAQA